MQDQLIYTLLVVFGLTLLSYWGLEGSFLVKLLLLLALFLSAYCAVLFGKLRKARPHDSFKRLIFSIAKRILFFLPSFYPLLFGALLLDLGLDDIRVLLPLLFLFLLCMPYLLIKTWNCRPLRQEPLSADLKALCDRMHFKCLGVYSWDLPHIAPTAAVCGFIPQGRYILITERMLAAFPESSILAVAAHEIGHSKSHHLLFMPLLLLGLMTPLLFFPFTEAWEIILFFPWAYGFYRIVGGFFSRLFEKEADLYGAENAGGPEEMIDALKRVALSSGITLDQYSWHHGSLQERIDLLERVKKDPKEERCFLRKVHFFQLFYIVCLILIGAIWLI